MAHPIADVIGHRFGPWTVVERSARKAKGNGGGSWYAVIRCNDCGNTRTASVCHLRKRPPRCVCQPRQSSPPHQRTGKWSNNHGALVHGHSVRGAYSPEYHIWRYIKQRCENPKKVSYRYYGARGIRMCEEWRADFMAFYGHVGARPSAEHSVERINNDGNYEPGNVRWATRTEQNRNKRPRYSVATKCG